MKYYSFYFGQAYSEGAYGEGNYSCTTEQQQAGTCSAGSVTGSPSGSGLTDTGIAVAAIITLACFIIFVSLIVRIWRRKPVVQEVLQTTEEAGAATERPRQDD
ncbi:MAG TPA: hypothetical protein VFT16_05310 [Candidatus Saccharimonadales bacterium]|nr:hypothetical protein [Candidatus Saccharimonadales bacterium]